jgi:hypothetical protein
MIALARVQRVEIGDAVDAEHHGLAVDGELVVLVLQRGFDNPRISSAAVVAVAAEQTNALTFALNDQAIAVIFDFVEPGGRRGDARA